MEYTIFIYWKNGIGEAECRAIIDGANTFADTLRNTRAAKMFNDSVRVCGVDHELDAFVRGLPKVGPYTNAPEIYTHLERTHDNHSIAVYLTDEPLSDSNMYVVGYTCAHHITLSTYHFRDLDTDAKLASLKLCVMHELGHAHGMARSGRVNTESAAGSHCTDPLCLMVQPYGDFSRLIRRHHSRWFCPLCLEETRTTKRNIEEYERLHGLTQPPPPPPPPEQSTTRSTTTVIPPLPPRRKRSSPPPLPPRRR